ITAFTCLTLDCYGTLIDWERGIYNSLAPLLTQLAPTHPFRSSRAACLRAFMTQESQLQTTHPSAPYSDLLAAIYLALAAELRLPAPSASDAAAFAASIASWPAYTDTVPALQRLARRYKLVILSNVDRESFAGTLAGGLAGVTFDAVYTAQDIGSYKPAARNFEFLIERCGSDLGVKKEEILHTAQSLFHDHVPAGRAGLASAWIARGTGPGEEESAMGGKIEDLEDRVDLTWRFGSMGAMADAVDEAVAK
ncbi:uncharacterized protein K452DRAFT_194651, partial [Aplosporella prunicola CBS 121167]